MPPQVVHVKNASKVAAALGNPKCRQILEYLAKHPDATETKLSKELKIALSTVHYNMKVLVEARLVLNDEYTYSAKGKEVTHYRINKNPIVIVQEEEQLQILKAVVPAALIAAGLGIAWTLIKSPFVDPMANNARFAMDTAAMPMAAEGGAEIMAKGAAMAPPAPSMIPQEMLPYFLAGIVSMLFLSFLIVMVFRWWNQRAQ